MWQAYYFCLYHFKLIGIRHNINRCATTMRYLIQIVSFLILPKQICYKFFRKSRGFLRKCQKSTVPCLSNYNSSVFFTALLLKNDV